MFTLKNDKYRRARGGKAFIVSLSCVACGAEVLLYQKDGDGQLKRCYLNRVLAPPQLENLQRKQDIKTPQDMPHLECPKCKVVIGSPMRHHDGRLAFKLRRGHVSKKRITA